MKPVISFFRALKADGCKHTFSKPHALPSSDFVAFRSGEKSSFIGADGKSIFSKPEEKHEDNEKETTEQTRTGSQSSSVVASKDG